MIIMKIVGGFTSQLSKYMLGYSVAKLMNTELVLHIGDFTGGYFRPFMLECLDLPNVRCISDERNFNGITNVSNGQQLLRIINNHSDEDIYLSNENVDYKEYYDEYREYFKGIESDFLVKLALKTPSVAVNDFLKLYSGAFLVAVHVRRGDFVALNWQDDTDVFKAGIGYVKQKYPEAKICFFSNDIAWVKKQFGVHKDFIYIEKRDDYIADVEDFFIMSACNIKIVSSFSGYGKYASKVGVLQHGFGKSICARLKNGTDDVALEDDFDYITLIDDEELKSGISLFNKLYAANPKETEVNHVKNEIFSRAAASCEPNATLRNAFWKKYYDISNEYFPEFVIISDEELSVWRIRGAYLVATILARVGARVKYFNLSKDANVKKINVKSAADMDGNSLHFDLYEGYIYAPSYIRMIKQMINNDTKVILNLEKTVLRHFFKNNTMIERNDINFDKWLSDISDEDEIFKISERSALEIARGALVNI